MTSDNDDDNSRPSTEWHYLFTPDDVESVRSDDLPDDWDVTDHEPVTVVLRVGGFTHTFWQGEGGVEPSHQVNDNGTLTVWRGNIKHVTYGPSAWMLVRGPERLP